MQTANRVAQFNESVIRDMTRLAIKHGAVNLSQGYPDFGTNQEILDEAAQAILGGFNQYSITWGYPPLRQKLAELYSNFLNWSVDPDKHVTVTCGVTEGIVISLMSVLNPGDEVIIFEPAHDNFRPAAIMAGASPIPYPLQKPNYRIEPEKLSSLVSARTKAILLNTPHNPTGRVFDQTELNAVIDVVLKHDLVLVTDEIYDRILYDGRQHVPPGSLPPLQNRTITISGFGKTYAITGWRLGFVIAPDELAKGLRPLHDFSTICAPTPLQVAACAALNLPANYYEKSNNAYHERRELMLSILDETGFIANRPEGAYYIMADYTQIRAPQSKLNASEFAHWLTREIGVAVVPGDSFYSDAQNGEGTVRFAFPKKLATLAEVGIRMKNI